MDASLGFMLFFFLWALYQIFGPPQLIQHPRRGLGGAQVVAGRVTGTQAAPPYASWAYLREWISPSKYLTFIQMQLMPIWELLHVLMRVLFDLLRAGYRSACRAVVAARNSSLARGPSAVAQSSTAPVQPDRLTG